MPFLAYHSRWRVQTRHKDKRGEAGIQRQLRARGHLVQVSREQMLCRGRVRSNSTDWPRRRVFMRVRQ